VGVDIGAPIVVGDAMGGFAAVGVDIGASIVVGDALGGFTAVGVDIGASIVVGDALGVTAVGVDIGASIAVGDALGVGATGNDGAAFGGETVSSWQKRKSRNSESRHRNLNKAAWVNWAGRINNNKSLDRTCIVLRV
jgi:hypothetical protein